MSNAPVPITATVNRSFAHAVESYLVALEMGEPRTTVPMPDLKPSDLARLAQEVVLDMRELADILKTFNLTPDQYARIRTLPFFAGALASAQIEWDSAKNVYERLKLEAAIGLEDALPKIQARMTKNDEALPGVVEAAKLFAKMAGVGEKDHAPSAPGEKFTISINLGDGHDLKFEREVAPASAGKTGPLQIDHEGPGD